MESAKPIGRSIFAPCMYCVYGVLLIAIYGLHYFDPQFLSDPFGIKRSTEFVPLSLQRNPPKLSGPELQRKQQADRLRLLQLVLALTAAVTLFLCAWFSRRQGLITAVVAISAAIASLSCFPFVQSWCAYLLADIQVLFVLLFFWGLSNVLRGPAPVVTSMERPLA